MAVYRLGPMVPAAGFAPTFERPVLCEACGTMVGSTLSMHHLRGIPAQSAVGLWPEAEDAIWRHERQCLRVRATPSPSLGSSHR